MKQNAKSRVSNAFAERSVRALSFTIFADAVSKVLLLRKSRVFAG